MAVALRSFVSALLSWGSRDGGDVGFLVEKLMIVDELGGIRLVLNALCTARCPGLLYATCCHVC